MLLSCITKISTIELKNLSYSQTFNVFISLDRPKKPHFAQIKSDLTVQFFEFSVPETIHNLRRLKGLQILHQIRQSRSYFSKLVYCTSDKIQPAFVHNLSFKTIDQVALSYDVNFPGKQKMHPLQDPCKKRTTWCRDFVHR